VGPAEAGPDLVGQVLACPVPDPVAQARECPVRGRPPDLAAPVPALAAFALEPILSPSTAPASHLADRVRFG